MGPPRRRRRPEQRRIAEGAAACGKGGVFRHFVHFRPRAVVLRPWVGAGALAAAAVLARDMHRFPSSSSALYVCERQRTRTTEWSKEERSKKRRDTDLRVATLLL